MISVLHTGGQRGKRVAGSQSDIRQIINMLATYKLGAKAMNFDASKKLCVYPPGLNAIDMTRDLTSCADGRLNSIWNVVLIKGFIF
jgi:hypothetical protein